MTARPINPSDDSRALAAALRDLAWLLPRTVAAGPGTPESLPSSELEVMRLLVRKPGLSVNEVASELRLHAANVSTAIRSLVERGLLERGRDARDGRVVRLHPNELAREHRERQEMAWGEAIEAALGDLPQREAARLRAAAPGLRALASSLAKGTSA